jgi:N-acetylglucosaminyldiphosphoundecaprenol N-acetyl-beta-D-mannosaminyltransferase
MIASGRPHYAATANVDFVVQAMEDIELRRILMDAHLVLADGMPLVWASRWLGNPLPERVTGSDMVPRLLARAEEKGWRVFFLGGSPGSVAAAARNVQAKHPALNLVGAYSPPFRPLLEMDHADILHRIRAARPDLLLVAFGCPKQEKWINMHYREAGVPLCVGVGATIDFLAGTVSRAPRWMQRSGLEWVYRLAQEPGRLFRRYAADAGSFGLGILRQGWQLRSRKRRPFEPLTASVGLKDHGAFRLLDVSPRLDAAAVREHQRVWEEASAAGMHVAVNLARVTFIDSTGVGLLLSLHKLLRSAGRHLVLLSPSAAVCRSIGLMRLDGFLPVAPTLEAAHQLVAERSSELPVVLTLRRGLNSCPFAWQGEIVASNTEAVWRSTEEHLRFWSRASRELAISLEDVRFIDSTGVALMVRVRKFGQQLGVEVSFVHASAPVRQVVRTLRMEAALLEEAR